MSKADLAVQLPADACVHCEVRTQLEVVLQEHRNIGPAIALVVAPLLTSGRVDVAVGRAVLCSAHAQKKILKGRKAQGTALLFRVVEIELIFLSDKAGANALLSVCPADLVIYLERVDYGGRLIIAATTQR